MKIIKIKIPTSFSEVKAWWKERTSKRYKHNKKIIEDFAIEICEEIKSGYWSKDISDYMKKEFTADYCGKIYKICRKYKKELK